MLNQHITNYLHPTNKYEFGIQTEPKTAQIMFLKF